MNKNKIGCIFIKITLILVSFFYLFLSDLNVGGSSYEKSNILVVFDAIAWILIILLTLSMFFKKTTSSVKGKSISIFRIVVATLSVTVIFILLWIFFLADLVGSVFY